MKGMQGPLSLRQADYAIRQVHYVQTPDTNVQAN